VTTAQSRTWLGFHTCKPSRGPNVHQLLHSPVNVRVNLGHVANPALVEPRREVPRGKVDTSCLHGTALPAPFADASVQYGHLGMAEDLEHPPDSGGTEIHSRAIVHHEVIRISQAQARHSFGELNLGREHVRQW
jgi:hypothetical protein